MSPKIIIVIYDEAQIRGILVRIFRNINIKFLKKRKMAFIISGLLLLGSLGSLFTNGLDQGVDFVGGRTYQVRFAQDVSASEITDLLLQKIT